LAVTHERNLVGYSRTKSSRGVQDISRLVPTENKLKSLCSGQAIDPSPGDRSVPFDFTIENSKIAMQGFKHFDVYNPVFTNHELFIHGAHLKSTYQWWCEINKNETAQAFAYEVCIMSIEKEFFNDQYSKLWKYARQCFWGKKWVEPIDFPFPTEFKEFFCDWKSFKKFLILANPKTPEVILPPALLFPWVDPLPQAIEILEEDHDPTPKINLEIFENIIKDLMHEPTNIYTDVDFLSEQVNTRKCCNCNDDQDLLRKVKKEEKITSYKYEAIVKWVQGGKKHQQPLAVRTPVWKAPSEYRDAVCLNPCTLYNVWYSNNNVKSVFGKAPEWADGCNQETLCRWASKSEFFIMTDYKKSGLTLPHWFVIMVNKNIRDRFPYLRMDIPEHGWLIYDKDLQKFFKPKNFGYSLGMVNHYYTLWNIALFHYAKKMDIFSANDRMLSFNDDSVIGCKKISYYQWLNVVRQAGGYLDVHKTFSATGAQFCEIHQFKGNNNFKWVSAFHTLFSALWKAVNFDHYRYLTGEMYDQLQVLQEDINNDRKSNLAIWQKTVDILYNVGCYRFQREIDPQLPFELGGINYTKDRTVLGLKKWLLTTEKMFYDGDPTWKMAVYTKQAFEYKIKYRPWVKIPEGEVKKTFEMLGQFEGIHHELQSFLDKAHNKFNLDNEFYNVKFWTHFAKKMNEARKAIEDNVFIDFIQWVRGQSFFACALPRSVVHTQKYFDGATLPFVRIQTESSKYSLQSMIVNYINVHKNLPEIFDKDLIDFSKIIQYEIPVLTCGNMYEPIVDMFLLGKISKYHDPRRVYLDYASREGHIPTSLYVEDTMSKAFLDIMKKIWPEDKFLLDFIGATWWTKIPLPFKKEWVPELSHCLPNLHVNYHVKMLENYFNGIPYEENTFIPIIDEKFIQSHQKYNPSFWQRALKGRKSAQNQRKKTGSKLRTRADVDVDNPFLQLNMDENLRLVEDFYLQREVRDPSPGPVSRNWDQEEIQRLLQQEFIDFSQAPHHSSEEEFVGEEDDEASILARYLDNNQLDWDQEDETEETE